MINKTILFYYLVVGCFLTTQAIQTVYLGATHIGYGNQIATKQRYQVSLNQYRNRLITEQKSAHSLAQASDFATERGFITSEPKSVVAISNILASL